MLSEPIEFANALLHHEGMPVQLIAVSEKSKDLEFCQEIADREKFDLCIPANTNDLQTLLIGQSDHLVFWDVDAVKTWTLSDVLPLVGRHCVPHRVFALSDRSVYEIPEANRYPAIGHYCVRKYDEFAHAWISRLCGPLFSADPFGLEFYRDADSVVRSIQLRSAREKCAAIDAFGSILTKRGMESRAVQMILRVIDELLMNALFDAPIDAHGKSYRRESPRDSDFALSKREEVTVELVQNAEFAVVGVRDSFGSFVWASATDRVRRDYAGHDYRPDLTTHSAGLGLQGIAANGVSLVIAAKRGIATEAIVAFPYYLHFRGTKTGFRSFSYNLREGNRS